MIVDTERANYFPDSGGYVVCHTFRTNEDGRRTTQFYSVLDKYQAEVLVTALLKKREDDE